MLGPVPFRVVLLKLTPAWSNAEGRRRLAEALTRDRPRRSGFISLEAGLPADAAAEKSWDLCLDVRFDSVEGAQGFDVLEHVTRVTGAAHEEVVALHKTWIFEVCR